MASNADPVLIPATSPVHGSQAPTTVVVQQSSGKSLPRSGKVVAQSAAAPQAVTPQPVAAQAQTAVQSAAAPDKPDLQAQVALLNKYLNDSGRPDQFRVDPSSGSKLIQQINPATGAVVGEFLASEFPALARSVGVSGVLVDSHV
jgi:uncharacterized FlaG/YvyC family protein